jgi:hypothetical protein
MPRGTNKWEGEDPGVDLARPVKQGLTGWPHPEYTGSGEPM